MRLARDYDLPPKRIGAASTPGAPWQSVRLVNDAVSAASTWIAPLRAELQRVLVGREALVDRLLVALLADGHLLVAGGPGLAQGRTVRALAAALGAKTDRLVLSPDLVPADLLGDVVLDPDTGALTLGPGTIFANLVLLEELDRAPPKVLNALLRAMEDREVTVLGERRALPDPFLVVATLAGPDDESGPSLTAAQADRFLLQVVLEHPDPEEERLWIDVVGHRQRMPVVRPVLTLEDLERARRVVGSVYADRMIKEYIVALVAATRGPVGNENAEISPGRATTSPTSFTAHGASPRATVDLIRASRATAFLAGRGYVTPRDVKAVAPDVLRHRITLSRGAKDPRLSPGEVVRRILDSVTVP